MTTVIKDGTGDAFSARVDSENRIHVDSLTQTLQHFTSHVKKSAYQVRGESTPVAGTSVILHIRNSYEAIDIVVTFIRLQSVGLTGGSALPNAANFFDVKVGDQSVSTGGSEAVPVNMYVGSPNTAASAVCRQGDPTLVGNSTEIDRWYDQGGAEMEIFNKDAALIIGPKRSLEIVYTGDHTSGTLQARVSFLLQGVEN